MIWSVNNNDFFKKLITIYTKLNHSSVQYRLMAILFYQERWKIDKLYDLLPKNHKSNSSSNSKS